jgi:RNA polymerase sigma-70 factor, ECF subfamily
MRSDVEQAVTLLKDGNGTSLEKALSILQQAVFTFGMRVCGHREDAEDTAQEVLVKAIPFLPKFNNSRALTKWLYTVAKNRCLMSRRKSKFAPRQELSLDELMPDREEPEQLDGSSIPNPESATLRGEQAQRLREAIRALPPHYRIVLVLRDMEGFTDEEAAEITGLRSGTIRIRLHRARLFVRRELQEKQGHLHSEKSEPLPARNRRCRKMFAGLSDYLDGELDDFSCQEIEAHLEGCEPCKKFLDSLRASIQTCQESPAECLDPQKNAILRKQLLATYSRALASSSK